MEKETETIHFQTPYTDIFIDEGVESGILEDSDSVKDNTAATFDVLEDFRQLCLQEIVTEQKPMEEQPLFGEAEKEYRRNEIQNSSHPECQSSPSLPSRSETNDFSKPDVVSLREKFELSARSSASEKFAFGEAFREKQRDSVLGEKERLRDARESIHGFSEMLIHQGKTDGSIDESHLQKIFAFEASPSKDKKNTELLEGVCKVLLDTEYKTGVFVVHRTRGMLLLKGCHQSESKEEEDFRIPGGGILSSEFFLAAKQTRHVRMQLQLAARESAASRLFEQTGIDVRYRLDRLQPALLRLGPPVDVNGTKLLKNEYENQLYFFLQVVEDDFIEDPGNGDIKLTDPEGESNSLLKLKLSDNLSAFDFVRDPREAMKILEGKGDKNTTDALKMIINEASVVQEGSNGAQPAKRPKIKSKTQSYKELTSNISNESTSSVVVVSCCCSFPMRTPEARFRIQ
jgi:hypothetical protein